MPASLRWPALIVAASLTLLGCAASAHFYSKNGQVYREVTGQAVRCEENEIHAVIAAGGFPIGVIDARGLSTRANEDDLADKAAKIAAKNGGTHILLTERGIDSFTVTNPEQKQRTCTRNDATVDCTTTYTAATTSIFEKPTAKFVVFVIPPERWPSLPPALQPHFER
jgi:hypothetical protein